MVAVVGVVVVVPEGGFVKAYSVSPFAPPQISFAFAAQAMLHRPSVAGPDVDASVLPQ